MSELLRLFTARFADNRPPLGESRLLGFATDPTAPQGPEQGPQGQKPTETDVTKLMGESQSKIEASLPGEMIRGFEEACESTEWMQELFNRPGTAEAKLREVLKAKGYPDADLQTLDPETLSLDVRRTITAEILRENPEFLVHLAESVERRIQQLPEVMADIEKKIKSALEKKFEIKQEHVKILSAESVTTLARLSHALNQIPNERLSAVVTQLQSSKEVEMGEAEIASALGLPAFQEQTKTERAVINFIIQLKNAIHRKKKFGAWLWSGKQPESNEAYDQKQSSYREDLEKEQQALREYIHVELTEKTEQIKREHIAKRDEILAKIKKTGEVLDTSEADIRLLATEGYDYEAFVQAAAVHLDPLHQLRLLKSWDSNRPKPRDEDFLSYAKEAFNVLQTRRKGAESSLAQLLEEKRRKQTQLNEWASDTAHQLRRLHQLPDGVHKNKIVAFLRMNGLDWSAITEWHDRFDPYAFLKNDPAECERQLQQSPEKRLLATDPEWDWDARHDTEIQNGALFSKAKPINTRQLLTAMFTLMERKPELLVGAQHDVAAAEQEQKALGSDAEIASVILKMRSNLQNVLREIEGSRHLEHVICKANEIPYLLDAKKRHIQQMLYVDDFGKPIVNEGSKKNLHLATREVKELEQTNRLLQSIDTNIVRKPLGDNRRAYFKDGIIYINNNKSADEQAAAQLHEEGHAILWALKSSFPLLLIEKYNKLKTLSTATSNETFEQILESLADTGPYRHVAAQMDSYRKDAVKKMSDAGDIEDETHRIYMEEMLEELIVRHSDWVRAGKPDRTNEDGTREQLLFDMLEKNPVFSKETIRALELAGTGMASGREKLMADDDMFGGEGTGEAKASADESGDNNNMHQSLKDIRRNIEYMKSFNEAYGDESPELKTAMQHHVDDTDAEYKNLTKTFLQLSGDGSIPEEDPAFVAKVARLKKFTEDIKANIKKLDVERLDISKEGKAKEPGFFSNIEFLSVLDLVKLWNDTKEDLVTSYKRRQDRALKRVGASVTEALGMGKHIPYWGEYFEGLRGYHERRYSNTDQEAAKKWQDSLHLVDSHEVLHMIGQTDNRDLVRGGIGLLVERGEMDWNDKGVWKTLQKMSGYRMPEKACERDDLLRDVWLRKMINEIWQDKEQYYHWKQANDSHIKSHKSEFTPTVDNLANVEGGLSNELRKQLTLFVEWKKDPHHPPVPDDVKPHLYEEILHYAMRNGKMSMEQKIFYLVQGVRYGMLSIDRLRVLAGEGGEILLRFPFIDYFYQKNNTLPEITRLGERLEEEGKDKFKPGAKTMLFLQFELAREESFKHRLSKALSRDNMEKIDHEDYPMIVGQVDYNVTDNMTGVLSGSRYKITKESAKNSYVGFNTKFKAFARLADMEKEGLARFTPNDARDMAVSIASFLHFDNILTRNGWDGKDRLTLTWNDINNTTAPSSNGMNVKVFRDRSYAFVHRLMDMLEQQGFSWDNVGVKREIYLQQMGQDVIRPSEATKEQKSAYAATAKFQKELERVFRKNPSGLKEVLSQQGDTANTMHLMEESAAEGDEYLTKDVTREYFAGLAKEEQVSVAGAHGGHH